MNKYIKQILSFALSIALVFGMAPVVGGYAFAETNEVKVFKGSSEVQEITGLKDAPVDSTYRIEIELKDGNTFNPEGGGLTYPNNANIKSPTSWIRNAPCEGTETDCLKETVVRNSDTKATITLSGNFKKNAYEPIEIKIPQDYIKNAPNHLKLTVNQYWAVGKCVVVTEMPKPVHGVEGLPLATDIKAKIKLLNLNFKSDISEDTDVTGWIKYSNTYPISGKGIRVDIRDFNSARDEATLVFSGTPTETCAYSPLKIEIPKAMVSSTEDVEHLNYQRYENFRIWIGGAKLKGNDNVISGAVGEKTEKEITVQMNAFDVKNVSVGDDVTSWFTAKTGSLPDDFGAKIKSYTGDAVITVSATPTEVSNAELQLTIPASKNELGIDVPVEGTIKCDITQKKITKINVTPVPISPADNGHAGVKVANLSVEGPDTPIEYKFVSGGDGILEVNGNVLQTRTNSTVQAKKYKVTLTATEKGHPTNTLKQNVEFTAVLGTIAAPVFQKAETNKEGTEVTVTFDKAMGVVYGKHAQFKLYDGTEYRQFNNASLDAGKTKMKLTVDGDPLVQGTTLKLSYTAGDVMALDNGVLESFTDKPVDNKTITAAKFVSAETDTTGNEVIVTFDREMADPTGKHDYFRLGPIEQFFNAAKLGSDAKKIVLTPISTLKHDGTYTLTYILGGSVKTKDGASLTPFSGKAIANNVLPLGAPPKAVSAETNTAGTQVIITFDKAMADPTGKHGDFYLVSGGGKTFSAAALDSDAKKIVLTVNGGIFKHGDFIYFKYSGTELKSADGGTLAPITTPFSVENRVPVAPVTIEDITVAPISVPDDQKGVAGVTVARLKAVGETTGVTYTLEPGGVNNDLFTLSTDTPTSMGYLKIAAGKAIEKGKTYTIKVKAEKTATNFLIKDVNVAVDVKEATSSDATIHSVLGYTITAGAETGTKLDPKTVTKTVANTITKLPKSGILVNSGATIELYSDSNFSQNKDQDIELVAGAETKAYVKVTAQDNVTTLYYVLKIIITKQEETPNATFTATDTDKGRLDGLVSEGKYEITGANPKKFTAVGTSQQLTNVSSGSILIVKKGNGTTTTDSLAQSISVTQAGIPTATAVACTNASNNDGKITGVTNAMQYKKSLDTVWEPVTGTAITNLGPGKYNVRVRAAGTVLASDTQTVTVAAYATPIDTTAPVLSAGSATNVGKTTAKLNFTSDEAGKYYYLVRVATDSYPTKDEIKTQGTAVAKGTGVAVVGAHTANVTGLTASTAYKAYVLAEDASANLSSILEIPFTTEAKENVALTVNQANSAFGQTLADPVYTEQSGAINKTVEYTGTVKKTGLSYATPLVKPQEAGTYTVKVKFETVDKIYEGTANFTIEQKAITDSMLILLGSLTYNGSIQTQLLELKDGSNTIAAGEYDVTDRQAENAGTYKLKVTMKAASNYTGTITKDFTIAKKDITPTVEVTGGAYVYTGNPVNPTFNVKDGLNVLAGTDFEAKVTNNVKAGNATITVKAKANGNYSFSDVVQTFTIGKATYTGTASITKNIVKGQTQAQEGTITLANLFTNIPEGAKIKAVNPTTGTLMESFTVSDDKLTYKSKANITSTASETYHVTIESSNYNDITADLIFIPSDKQDAHVTLGTVPANLVYGGANFNITANAATTGANPVWNWEVATGDAVEVVTGNSAVATFKIVKAGDVQIKVHYESDTSVGEIVTSTITVKKAKVTVKANNKSIYVNDTVPSLASPTNADYTVTGLVGGDVLGGAATMQYQKDGVVVVPDNTKTGVYDIVISGFTNPSAAKYEDIVFEKGALNINVKSSGGKKSSSSTVTTPDQPKSVTVKNEAAKDLVKNITDQKQADAIDTLVDNKPVTEKKAALKALTTDTKTKVAAVVLPKYTDVKTDAWYSNDLTVMMIMGLVKGTGANAVSPKKNVTGREMMAMLVRSMGKEVKQSAGANWYDAYKAEATALKLDNGIKFDLSKDLTRAEVATMMYQYVKLNEKDNAAVANNALANVKDAKDIPAEYKDAVAYMYQKGLLKGYENGSFGANKTLTRVEVATILARLLTM